MAHSGLELSSSVPQGSAQLLSKKRACVTGLPLCCINRTKHSAELAADGGHPLSGCAGLPPYSGGRIKPLYVFPRSHVAQW